ncbi:MAG: hypothetical protein F6K04_01220 [Leptolyngbya sp. SIO4C5]|nr:hypothetical protein [Leptolyngbya sp. SIO4C5]
MIEKWDDIFSAAQGKAEPSSEPDPPAKPKATPKSKPPRAARPAAKASPWADLEPEGKEPTVRLNVDISLSLNDRLAEKARKLRKPKSELVRRLLEWALDDSIE